MQNCARGASKSAKRRAGFVLMFPCGLFVPEFVSLPYTPTSSKRAVLHGIAARDDGVRSASVAEAIRLFEVRGVGVAGKQLGHSVVGLSISSGRRNESWSSASILVCFACVPCGAENARMRKDSCFAEILHAGVRGRSGKNRRRSIVRTRAERFRSAASSGSQERPVLVGCSCHCVRR